MGGSSWSNDFYAARSADRVTKGVDGKTNYHTKAVAAGTAPALNPALDPSRKVTKGPFEGQNLREARDSDTHPNSTPIIVMFDVTGSMRTVPAVLQKKLGGLMAMLIQKGVTDPAIMFMANGDANSDEVPLQVGNFESGNEMDEDLDKFFLEGNGGGQHSETYELGAYYVLNHTATDAWEKRQQKGYLFIVGDENYYPAVRREQIRTIIGDNTEADIDSVEVFKQLEEKWNLFLIRPLNSQHGAGGHAKTIEESWRKVVGENIIKLDDANNICETVALAVAMMEGTATGAGDLIDMGVDAAVANSVSNALVPIAKNVLAKPVGVGTALAEAGDTGSVTRI